MSLPGVNVVLTDRFFTLSRTDIPTGPKVMVIAARTTPDLTDDGTGHKVADYDPYRATNEKFVELAFGSGSPAHRGYLEAVSGGAARVFIVAYPKGITDANIQSLVNVTITGDGTDHNHGAHIPFDAAFDAAETELPNIIACWGRGWHPLDNEFPATPTDDVPIGMYADDSNVFANSMAMRVAGRCQLISSRSAPVFGVLGVRPFGPGASGATPVGSPERMTAANISTHVTLPNLFNKDLTTNVNGMYLNVIQTEARPVGYGIDPTNKSGPNIFGYSNGACVYGGFLSQLKSWSASTGKVIFNVSALRYNTTRTQQEGLIAKGVVPVTLDFNRAPIFVDGVTFSQLGSDYSRLTTLRIIFDAINLVRNVSQGFIGEAATLQQRNALETAIGAALRAMQQLGALLSSDFNVSYVPEKNEALVDLVLRPAFELRNIEISVSVQF